MRVSPEAFWISALQKVDQDWKDKTEDEEVKQTMVSRFGGEEAARTHSAPDGTGVEVSAGKRTCESIDGVLGADSFDVCECPIEDADLRKRRDTEGRQLNYEELTWWNLCCQSRIFTCSGKFTYTAIVSQLQVLRELQCLDTGHIAEVEEPDVRQHATLPDVACNNPTEHIDIDS